MDTSGPPSDEELVRRLRAGDVDASRVLHARYADVLRARVRRRIGGRLRRKVGESDVVQDAFLAAFRDLSSFEDRGPGSFRRWIERIVACRAKDQWRHFAGRAKRAAVREESVDPRLSAVEPVAIGPTPSVEAADAEGRARLRRAVEAMEGDDRLVLELVGRDGKDFGEAGRLMGRSSEAARKLYSRALVRLSAVVQRTP